MKTSANRSWLFPEIPAQERVFQIFSSRMTMAARWDRSPVSRKMFMATAVGAVAPGSAAQAAAAAPNKDSFCSQNPNPLPFTGKKHVNKSTSLPMSLVHLQS